MRHNQQSVLGVIVTTATERQSLVLGLIGVAVAIIAHLVVVDQKVPLWAFWYLAIFLIIIVGVCIAALKTALDSEKISLPSIRAVIEDNADKELPFLLLDSSELFGHSTLVSIYHRNAESGFEALIGHGTVYTVQSDLRIQVKIDKWLPGNDDLITSIKSQNGAILSQTLVRPSVQRGSTDSQFRSDIASLFETLKSDPSLEDRG